MGISTSDEMWIVLVSMIRFAEVAYVAINLAITPKSLEIPI